MISSFKLNSLIVPGINEPAYIGAYITNYDCESLSIHLMSNPADPATGHIRGYNLFGFGEDGLDLYRAIGSGHVHIVGLDLSKKKSLKVIGIDMI